MKTICSLCVGLGMRVVRRDDGTQVAQECGCRFEARTMKLLSRAQIPPRYEHCSLESFETKFAGAHRSIGIALSTARGFVHGYPLETNGQGLLITGTIGTGKTHIATGILQALIAERGALGLFCDYRDLLKKVQNTYNNQVSETELDVLQPVFKAEVLVLDELGAAKPTDWVWDTIAHILNTRYNERRTTIITTNYANVAPLGTGGSEMQRAVREETLGDRIGERMRSRLREMCVHIEMTGPDFRESVKRATFS